LEGKRGLYALFFYAGVWGKKKLCFAQEQGFF
jgi:hypothetical protein